MTLKKRQPYILCVYTYYILYILETSQIHAQLECIGSIPTFGSVCVCIHVGCVLMCVYDLVHLLSIHPYHYMFMCTLFFLYIIILYVIWTIHYEYHKRKHYTFISIVLCIWIMSNKWLSCTLYTLESSQISSIGVSLQY